MGKNQAHKQMQRAKMSSHASAGPDEESNDGMMDGSFHSPEWHAARLASLQTSHTITWDEWKAKQKKEAMEKELLAGDEEREMKEYRAQLDAERASKLARGRNHADKTEKVKGKKDKDKGKKEKDKSGSSEKKRKRKEKAKKGSDSESESDDDRERRREKRKSKKDKDKGKSRRKKEQSGSEGEEDGEGPVRLSAFFSAEGEDA
eukprot:TRINITY_DN978_c0_g1_i3.p1 TRINITY_DN978_c0_g1~~TRINITY_DN978_c0_g1_i3.p1  ORF type:complete len:204 (-),score=63.09 TRINITY_DN978_c0_g1_i3:237-848(-)